eukprot:9500741-Pyramimonas_sp.AAC.1
MGERAAATSKLLHAMLITKTAQGAGDGHACRHARGFRCLAGDQERVRPWGGQQVRSHAQRPAQPQ